MRETRQSGSEGGARSIPWPFPYRKRRPAIGGTVRMRPRRVKRQRGIDLGGGRGLILTH